MEKTSTGLVGAIIIASIILIILAVFTLLFFLLYIKKRMNLKQQNENLKIRFEQELLQTQIEIQEETFNHISEEIHDNIGQVLSFLKLNLSHDDQMHRADLEEKISSSKELVSAVIADLRNLSKSLSYDFIKDFGLIDSIKNELQKINNTGKIDANLKIVGNEYDFSAQFNLLIFRIFQEGINNIIKHAKASVIMVRLSYAPDHFTLEIKDNGIGFQADSLAAKQGLGLKNMKKRASLLNGTFNIRHNEGEGTVLTLKLMNQA